MRLLAIAPVKPIVLPEQHSDLAVDESIGCSFKQLFAGV